ncbi:MAG: hypothetical protein FWK04_01680 [Nostoc sp. GBBB01]|nr:hypothetical protein [Nostoc sp. GBBB01]
MFLKFLQAVIP